VSGLTIEAGEVKIGDRIFVTPRVGFREVVEVDEYDMLGIQPIECVVFSYESFHGAAWENRASVKGVSSYRRDVAAMRPIPVHDLVLIA
jgi:hypothetical protein